MVITWEGANVWRTNKEYFFRLKHDLLAGNNFDLHERCAPLMGPPEPFHIPYHKE
jgi:hypothetical protein